MTRVIIEGDCMKSKREKIFIQRIKKFPEVIYDEGEQAVMEGFEYYGTEEYRSKPHAIKSRPKQMYRTQGPIQMARLGRYMIKKLPGMLKNINQNYTDMEPYVSAMENHIELPKTPQALVDSYPNTALWEEFRTYVWERYRVIVGFTKISEEYIFKGKAIPFRYALVFAQEMQKEAIEKAPQLEAGMEVANVYYSLGVITNEISRYLKEKYHIISMANHPLGGLIDFIPLAQKAGLGHIGRHGLIITPEFGPRCRISPILIDEKLFEYTPNQHTWIGEFCKKCGKCQKTCPTQAIYESPKLSLEYHSEETMDRYESFDREKCFTSFSGTMGCAVCISVCPFSRNPEIYHKMKAKYQS